MAHCLALLPNLVQFCLYFGIMRVGGAVEEEVGGAVHLSYNWLLLKWNK